MGKKDCCTTDPHNKEAVCWRPGEKPCPYVRGWKCPPPYVPAPIDPATLPKYPKFIIMDISPKDSLRCPHCYKRIKGHAVLQVELDEKFGVEKVKDYACTAFCLSYEELLAIHLKHNPPKPRILFPRKED